MNFSGDQLDHLFGRKTKDILPVTKLFDTRISINRVVVAFTSLYPQHPLTHTQIMVVPSETATTPRVSSSSSLDLSLWSCQHFFGVELGAGADHISSGPPIGLFLLLVLACLGCAATVACTTILSRWWHGLWAGLHKFDILL